MSLLQLIFGSKKLLDDELLNDMIDSSPSV